MSERKAVIKNADMSEDMQQDAVDCASQALEKYNIEKVSQLNFSILLFFIVNSVFIFSRLFIENFRILLPTSRRSLTKSITLPGIVLLVEIFAPM